MQSNPNTEKQDKVVFVIDPKSDTKVLPISLDVHDYVSKTLEAIMVSNNALSDTMFIGGNINSLSVWIANIVSLYQLKQMQIFDNTIQFIDDPDFVLDN